MRPLLYASAGALSVSLLVWWFARRSLRQELAKGSDQLITEFRAEGENLEAVLARGARDARAQVKAEVARTVPPMVQRQITTTLMTYGITPQLSQQITRVLRAATNAGLLGAP